MKNQRLLSSLYGKLDDALADGKIRADAAAKDIRAKLSWFNEYVTATRFLFQDLQHIITNNCLESFQAIVKSRIDDYAKAQAAKEEAERKRIQAEEQRKAEAAQAKKLEAERAAIRAEEQAKARAEAEQKREKEIAEKITEMRFKAIEDQIIKDMNEQARIKIEAERKQAASIIQKAQDHANRKADAEPVDYFAEVNNGVVLVDVEQEGELITIETITILKSEYDNLLVRSKRLDEIIRLRKMAQHTRDIANHADRSEDRNRELKQAQCYDRQMNELLN
jgi:hypothetical protein